MSLVIRAMAASDWISSTVAVCAPGFRRPSKGLLRRCSAHTKGSAMRVATASGIAMSVASCRLNWTPSVFGRISVNWSIAKVNASEKSQIHWSP